MSEPMLRIAAAYRELRDSKSPVLAHERRVGALLNELTGVDFMQNGRLDWAGLDDFLMERYGWRPGAFRDLTPTRAEGLLRAAARRAGQPTGTRINPQSERSKSGESRLRDYKSADWLHANEGIVPSRLSEKARAELVRTMPAPKGYTDVEGKHPRLLYHVDDAQTYCSPQHVKQKPRKMLGRRRS